MTPALAANLSLVVGLMLGCWTGIQIQRIRYRHTKEHVARYHESLIQLEQVCGPSSPHVCAIVDHLRQVDARPGCPADVQAITDLQRLKRHFTEIDKRTYDAGYVDACSQFNEKTSPSA